MRIRVSEEISKEEGRFWLLLPILVCAGLLLALAVGCNLPKGQQEDRGRLDQEYEIVSEKDIPEKLKEAIEKKKAADCKISYENGDSLYLVRGYGEQETGGYSIKVKELSARDQILYFDTDLVGPGQGTRPQKKPSYPYIVVKTRGGNQNVVFE